MSQFNQDKFVIDFYNNKQSGYFVEIGASDGIQLSNTYILEKNYNWKGICVEPIPDKYKKLKKNRPNSYCYNNPIYNQSNIDIEFSICTNGSLFSGIKNHITTYKNRLENNSCNIILKTLSINDLLINSNAPEFIDYLSIDTEGSEYEIIKSLDFSKYKFGLLSIEHNFDINYKNKINELLVKNNYTCIKQLGADDIYKYNL